MRLMLTFIKEIVDGIAVGNHESVVTPLVAQDIDEQTVAGAAGLTLETLVGARSRLVGSTFMEWRRGSGPLWTA